MNITKALSLIFALIFALTACGKVPSENVENNSDSVEILLSDNGITVDGEAAGKNNSSAVYTANAN